MFIFVLYWCRNTRILAVMCRTDIDHAPWIVAFQHMYYTQFPHFSQLLALSIAVHRNLLSLLSQYTTEARGALF